MNSLDPPKKKIKFEEMSAPPLLTAMVVITMIFTYWLMSGKDATAYTEMWFKPSAVMEFIATQQWPKLANVWFSANFGSINLWQLSFGIYFVGLFGTVVEKRLGPGRYLLVLLLGTTVPWVIQYWDTGNAVISLLPGEHPSKLDIMYVGPFFLTCAILGAYIVLAPPKKMDLSGGMPRPKYEIFNKKVEKPAHERFGLNPYTFVSAFFFYQLAMHACMLYLWPSPAYDVGGMFAAAVSVGIGYGIANYLLTSAVESFKDGPMKLEAVRRYNELIDLDVTHDDAVKGAARAMGLPIDQVRLWVDKNKNRLRIS
jgi:membrane associated rhomboid family serine protease